MKQTDGQAIDGMDDQWIVYCPECDTELEFKGYFDSEDIVNCSCGCKFTVPRVWLDDETYIGIRY